MRDRDFNATLRSSLRSRECIPVIFDHHIDDAMGSDADSNYGHRNWVMAVLTLAETESCLRTIVAAPLC